MIFFGFSFDFLTILGMNIIHGNENRAPTKVPIRGTIRGTDHGTEQSVGREGIGAPTKVPWKYYESDKTRLLITRFRDKEAVPASGRRQIKEKGLFCTDTSPLMRQNSLHVGVSFNRPMGVVVVIMPADTSENSVEHFRGTLDIVSEASGKSRVIHNLTGYFPNCQHSLAFPNNKVNQHCLTCRNEVLCRDDRRNSQFPEPFDNLVSDSGYTVHGHANRTLTVHGDFHILDCGFLLHFFLLRFRFK